MNKDIVLGMLDSLFDSSSNIQHEHHDSAARVSTRKLHLETGFYHRPKYESHKDGLYRRCGRQNGATVVRSESERSLVLLPL